MGRNWIAEADAIREARAEELAALANARIASALADWANVYPTRALELGFGMGSEWGRCDGRILDIDADALELRIAPKSAPNAAPSILWRGVAARALCAAIADVIEICGGYRDACPDDARTAPQGAGGFDHAEIRS